MTRDVARVAGCSVASVATDRSLASHACFTWHSTYRLFIVSQQLQKLQEHPVLGAMIMNNTTAILKVLTMSTVYSVATVVMLCSMSGWALKAFTILPIYSIATAAKYSGVTPTNFLFHDPSNTMMCWGGQWGDQRTVPPSHPTGPPAHHHIGRMCCILESPLWTLSTKSRPKVNPSPSPERRPMVKVSDAP
ncbi:hypothetical protein C8J57DRAFT_1226414 [Mycena rebaudengoi]|nr:hypothetical protein C8J57DRAFT_1226414 [Mycena rebaudengoi]